MQIRILTPERTVLESDQAEHVLLPAEGGQVGILPRHIAMTCSLQEGTVRVDLPHQSVEMTITGGLAELVADRITVLADSVTEGEPSAPDEVPAESP